MKHLKNIRSSEGSNAPVSRTRIRGYTADEAVERIIAERDENIAFKLFLELLESQDCTNEHLTKIVERVKHPSIKQVIADAIVEVAIHRDTRQSRDCIINSQQDLTHSDILSTTILKLLDDNACKTA